MFQSNNNNVVEKISIQHEKESYIVNILIRTLYSNSVSNDECYRIIKLFQEKVLGVNDLDYTPIG